MCPNTTKPNDEIKPIIQEHRNIIVEFLINIIRLIQRRINQVELEGESDTSSNETTEEELDEEILELEQN